MRIALIGANGQLGSDLRERLRGEVVPLHRPEFDICDALAVERTIDNLAPGYVINCAAMTNVDACEDECAAAYEINAIGAATVAKAAAAIDAPVMYISTDYVFGAAGRRERPYVESDAPGPLGVYGASKLAGEHMTATYNSRHVIVRSCGLYGRAGARGKGGNFVETIRRLARGDGPLRIVDDQRLSPTSTWELAARIGDVIAVGATGMYHVVASDSCTWCEFARMIVEIDGLDAEVIPITSDEYPMKARRPEYSALASERIGQIDVAQCPGCRDMLTEYLQTTRPAASEAPRRTA